MAACPECWKPEMSEIEKRIKRHNQENHLVEERIFSSEELSEYFIHLLKTQKADPAILTEYYRGEIPETVAGIISYASSPNINTEALSKVYAFRRENFYIEEGYDVSIERMFRYIPVHWHTNEYFTICYCVNGNCPVHFEHETVSLHPGNIMIIAPNTMHAAPCYADDRILVMYYLRSTTFKQVFWDNLSDMPLVSSFISKGLSGETGTPYLFYPIDRDSLLDQLLYAVYEESLLNKPFAQRMINGLINIFFLSLLRNYNQSVRFSSYVKTKWKPEYLSIFQYIQEHYASITMSELQQRFHYSDRQLNRIIQGCTGKNYSALIQQLRMEKAKILLLRKNISTEHIAEAVGYHDINAFYRAFRSFTGSTPKQWKQLINNSGG